MKKACSGLTTMPSRARVAAGAASSARGTVPNLSSASSSPAGVPGTPHEAAPTWNTCADSGVKWTGIGTSSERRSSRSAPGAATKKSSTVVRPPVWTSM